MQLRLPARLQPLHLSLPGCGTPTHAQCMLPPLQGPVITFIGIATATILPLIAGESAVGQVKDRAAACLPAIHWAPMHAPASASSADNIYNTAQLPGGNGSALRGNITIAGLLWAVIGNFFVLLATAYHNLSAADAHQHSTAAHYPGRTSGSDGGSSGQNKNLDAAAGV